MPNKPIKRPFTIYVILLVLISLAVYFSVSAYLLGLRKDGGFGGDIFNYSLPFIFFITAISLYLNRTWSKFLIYFLSFFYVVGWSLFSFGVVQEMMKYDISIDDISMLEIFIYLILGFLVLFAWIGSCFVVTKSCFVVTKYFNRISRPNRVIPL